MLLFRGENISTAPRIGDFLWFNPIIWPGLWRHLVLWIRKRKRTRTRKHSTNTQARFIREKNIFQLQWQESSRWITLWIWSIQMIHAQAFSCTICGSRTKFAIQIRLMLITRRNIHGSILLKWTSSIYNCIISRMYWLALIVHSWGWWMQETSWVELRNRASHVSTILYGTWLFTVKGLKLVLCCPNWKYVLSFHEKSLCSNELRPSSILD